MNYFRVWGKMIALLFSFSFFVPSLSHADNTKMDTLAAPPTLYELIAPEKKADALKDIGEALLKSEEFRAGECKATKVKNSKGTLNFVCQKADCKTDQLFRSVARDGVALKTTTSTQVYALVLCPTGCKYGTCNNGQRGCCNNTGSPCK